MSFQMLKASKHKEAFTEAFTWNFIRINVRNCEVNNLTSFEHNYEDLTCSLRKTYEFEKKFVWEK